MTQMRYTVIVQDGDIVNQHLRAIAPSIRDSCSHNHRTYEAAEKCREKLQAWRVEHNQYICNAHWYNACIHRHTASSMDYITDPSNPN